MYYLIDISLSAVPGVMLGPMETLGQVDSVAKRYFPYAVFGSAGDFEDGVAYENGTVWLVMAETP